MHWRILITFGIAAIGLAIPAAEPVGQPSPLPIPTTTITANGAAEALDVARRAGLHVDASAISIEGDRGEHKNAPFWSVLERITSSTDSRIELSDLGRKITLVKHAGIREPSYVNGPFRVAVRQVNGRLDLGTGTSFQELELLVHWEPRFPVFRIDSIPTITTAKDDLGNKLMAMSASAMSPVHNASSHVLPVRLLRVPRKAGAIAELAGHFTVTAAERMLPFRFATDKLPAEGTLPAGVDSGKVKATLTGWEPIRINGVEHWEATIHLVYPPGMPEFQSFETWLGENKLRLITPQGGVIAPDQVEEPSPGREMTVIYRFTAAKLGGAPKGPGWSLVYDTPAPLKEFRVPFELKNVPLP